MARQERVRRVDVGHLFHHELVVGPPEIDRRRASVGSTSMDLTLRPTTLEDLPILFEHQADPVGAKMAAFASRDWDAFVAHDAKLRDDLAAIRRTIVVDGEVVGSIGCWGDDEREIGYWIGREHWGRGIATASVRAFIAEIPDRPLHAYVAEHNVASMKVVVANGFVQVGRHEDEGVVHLVFRLDPGETRVHQ
jgi:RimJ/RimL family protein N-acetyltransferase